MKQRSQPQRISLLKLVAVVAMLLLLPQAISAQVDKAPPKANDSTHAHDDHSHDAHDHHESNHDGHQHESSQATGLAPQAWWLLIGYSVLISLASLMGGALPGRVQLTHTRMLGC